MNTNRKHKIDRVSVKSQVNNNTHYLKATKENYVLKVQCPKHTSSAMHTHNTRAAMHLPSLCHLTAAAHCTQQSCPDWTLPVVSQSWDHRHPPYLGTGCAHSRPAAQCGQCKCYPIHEGGGAGSGVRQVIVEGEKSIGKGVTYKWTDGS